MFEHALNRASVKQICSEVQRARQRVFRLIYREHQIELRKAVLDGNRLNVQAWYVHLFTRSVLQNKPNLEERLMSETALGL